MKWIDNLVELTETGKVGKCPCCGSDDTSYSANKINGDFGHIVLWCNSCNKGYNASRIKIQDNLKTNTPIPNNISL